jgi:hypothetical protein
MTRNPRGRAKNFYRAAAWISLPLGKAHERSSDRLAPDHSQQQPARRGSGKTSLKYVLRR